jgi:hypothetical protein
MTAIRRIDSVACANRNSGPDQQEQRENSK